MIELLAIIVILAIIAVITIPIILNVIDNSKRGAAIDSAYGYRDAIQNYYIIKSVANTQQELPSGYMSISELPNDFTVSGEKPSDGWIKLDKGSVLSFSLKIGDYTVTMNDDGNVMAEKGGEVILASTQDISVGGTVYIGDEGFYVMTINDGIATLLANTCLIDDNGTWRQVTGNENCNSEVFSSLVYWENEISPWSNGGLKSEYAYDVTGTIPANYGENPIPYIYYVKGNDSNNIDDIVDAYAITLSATATGRLLTFEEAMQLDSTVKSMVTYYWLGSASGSYVENIHNDTICVDPPSYRRNVRPVIEIPISEIQ